MDRLFATKSEGVGLIVCTISFQDFQPVITLNPPTLQTDGRTTCDRKTALCTKVHCVVKIRRGGLMQNIVINMREKFHYDRLGNDRALQNRKLITTRTTRTRTRTMFVAIGGPCPCPKNGLSSQYEYIEFCSKPARRAIAGLFSSARMSYYCRYCGCSYDSG